jgi:hypothetical protein
MKYVLTAIRRKYSLILVLFNKSQQHSLMHYSLSLSTFNDVDSMQMLYSTG